MDAEVIRAVNKSIASLVKGMSRADIIAQSIQQHGAAILVDRLEQLIDIANEIAPEHLQIFHGQQQKISEQIRNAGAIFIGQYSAESLGDYCAGPNHVLPTSGTARFSSPLGVYDFQKRTSVLQISQQGAVQMAPHADRLAQSESLQAHAESARFRAEGKS